MTFKKGDKVEVIGEYNGYNAGTILTVENTIQNVCWFEEPNTKGSTDWGIRNSNLKLPFKTWRKRYNK